MTDTQNTPVGDLVDRTAIDRNGEKIGTVFDVYLDNASGQPEWLAVNTGLFGTKVSFVPLAGATFADDDVMVAYDKALVKDAPKADADGALTPEEETELYAHYGMTATSTTTNGPAGDVGDIESDVTRARGVDESMTRSEEEIDVSTRTTETGRVRLHKWVETENVQMTVPIRREKARLVTEPITDANRDEAMTGEDLTSAEHEVVLHEEVVDVDKRVVPKERVRLETEVETDEVTVDDEVRKERIEMDQDVENSETRGR